jgi:hypothetical protein
MEKLQQHITEIEQKIQFHENENSSISKATVGWHLDHSLKVINGILVQLKNSNPSDYRWKFNSKRALVYTLGHIPRGKGKAPKSVQSFEKITLSDLEKQLNHARNEINILKTLDKKSNFEHPFFGTLNLKQTIYFLNLHTKHHLKIINDILKK